MSLPATTRDLAAWVANSLADLSEAAPDQPFWQRTAQGPGPGWTLCHLVAENDAVLAVLDPGAGPVLPVDPAPFLMGSPGTVADPPPRAAAVAWFRASTARLDRLLAERADALAARPMAGPPLGPEITTALGEVLHLAVTHPAMHLALLVRWRRGLDPAPG
jgi:hypothetical protein